MRYTVSGKPVLEFHLAMTDPHRPEQNHSIRVVNRRESSVEVQRQLRKGVSVIVEGQLYQKKYEVSGSKRKQPEIQLESLSILG